MAAAATLIGFTSPATASGSSANASPAATGNDEYIVVFKDQGMKPRATHREATALNAQYGGNITHRYGSVIDGYAAVMTPAEAAEVAQDPSVASVRKTTKMTIAGEQSNPPSWGVDRVDQRDLPLDNTYTYPDTAGKGTHVYVLDTGLRASHTDFTGRVGEGIDTVDGDSDPNDCNGHGTHVAGTAVGTKYGVAKQATVHPVRVLDCNGSGTDADIIAGIDWVTANAVKPAVVNYSITCTAQCPDNPIGDAVEKLLDSGIQWVQAAGNNDDACYYRPQSIGRTITVGNATKSDAKAWDSNHGQCLDIWAPGTDIVSASHTSDNGNVTMSGTSMASPHVAGAAALYLADHGNATPAQIKEALLDNASSDKLSGIGNSPNLLLHTAFMNSAEPDPDPDPEPNDVSVTNPGDQSTQAGDSVDLTIEASGGTAPYTFSATGLPSGLSIDASTGVISGTASDAGDSEVTVSVTDSSSPALSDSVSFGWTVSASAEPDPDPEPSNCANGIVQTGSLSEGQSKTLPSFELSESGAVDVCLDGPDGADFDVFLQRSFNGTWMTVFQGTSPQADEAFTFYNTPGSYRLVVEAYSGSGTYTVGVSH